MITQEQLEQWRALADAATPGPWELKNYGKSVYLAGPAIEDIIGRIQFHAGADAAFIAAARAAVPALLAEVERLTAEVRRYEEAEHQREMEHEAANDY